MKTFKLTVYSNEEWERHYEVEAEDLEEAKAMVEQETTEPVESHRQEIMITGIEED